MDSDELAERGTPEFYREQAERLTRLAAEINTAVTRIELLEIAAVFQRMADRLSARHKPPGDIDAETA